MRDGAGAAPDTAGPRAPGTAARRRRIGCNRTAMDDAHVNRRELLAGAMAAGAAVALHGRAEAGPALERSTILDFRSLGPGDGWPGWRCTGVANLRRGDGAGVLEAGSDVFPCDPRPVAFALDRRLRDGEIAAVVRASGAGAGVVLRRVGPRDYYAAVYDDERGALVLLRRSPAGAAELASAPLPRPGAPFRLSLAASGARPTELRATLDDGRGAPVTVAARDSASALQAAGDPGVLATARTLVPSEGPAPLPALGNLHLLPYGVQEGQAVMQTAVGESVLATIRERSTALFEEIAVSTSGGTGPTVPSIVAATTGAPRTGGAELRVATDVPARVVIEISEDPRFRRSRRVSAGRTGEFGSVIATASGLRPGRRVYWRARVRRGRRSSVGPVRSLRVLPRAGSGKAATLAIGSCAVQFGPAFDRIAERAPDVFVWQGDLNYPDTVGPLAQTVPGYAGIWRDFLANPRMRAIFEGAMFAAQRDDHDYGVQDANSTNLLPWGLAPWERLVERRLHYRFSAGLLDCWVLDQRRFKTDPTAPDTPAKTLLGTAQRDWLLRTLAASRAPFKVICSPCTLAPLPANARDGSWAAGFTAERDLLLEHVAERVSGQTLFVTGDTHWTMAYERDGLFEARPCPLGIPTPNDITLTQPNAAEEARAAPGVAYADDERGHFALLKVSGAGRAATLDLTLVREDGAEPFHRRFEQPRGGA
ncbi:MAG TPA: alkaline phosphatase D family protein [Thermoleophilaceae bacterium]